MNEIAGLDYRDSPVVSMELVKFLSLNTAIESVDRLEAQSSDHHTAIKLLTKEANIAKTAVNTVGNRTDEVKKTLDAVKRRLDKLERK